MSELAAVLGSLVVLIGGWLGYSSWRSKQRRTGADDERRKFARAELARIEEAEAEIDAETDARVTDAKDRLREEIENPTESFEDLFEEARKIREELLR
jgi:hypothetical protein